jgi:hypothetical protein
MRVSHGAAVDVFFMKGILRQFREPKQSCTGDNCDILIFQSLRPGPVGRLQRGYTRYRRVERVYEM